MVRVVIEGTGKELEILGTKIRYVKQVADIGEVTKVNTSYSWSMKFPKTAANTEILEGLGIVGDTSTIPYRKIYCNIIDNGLTVVNKGLLKVQSTDDEYKAFIQDGIIEFFTDISIDKVSDVIDLSNLDHENTVANIIASFTNIEYRYIIASYNGPPLANLFDTTNLNPFALTPSINVEYLWNRIFEHYGWGYSGDINMEGLWMTYPNAIGFSEEGNIEVLGANAKPITYDTANDNDEHRAQWNVVSIDAAHVSIGPVGQEHSIVFAQAGNYRIKIKMFGLWVRTFPPDSQAYKNYVKLNGVAISDIFYSNTDDEIVLDIIAFNNSLLQLIVKNPDNATGLIYVLPSSYMKIETLGVQTISFSKALIKYKVADFFKEILVRQALIPFADIDNKTINFINLSNLLNADAIDWSDKYIRRKKESYVYKSYAKSNYLRHKYDDKESDYKDGILTVENENLKIAKTIYKSKTYAPEEELQEFLNAGTSYFVNIFKMFSVELKEDPDTGDLLADYKTLKDRFFIFSAEVVDRDLYILSNLVESFPLASLNGNTFDDIVQDNYAEINAILNETRLHLIELALTKWDVATLDLSKRYYFKQEKNYYLLNKLTWESGNVCTGEFVRLL